MPTAVRVRFAFVVLLAVHIQPQAFAFQQTSQRHSGVSLQWVQGVDQAPQLGQVAGGAVAECRFQGSIDILGLRSLMAILFQKRLDGEKDFSSSTDSWGVRKPTFLKL
jgi:hypothetical protein